jgi:aryl-alcohol dehydrogenase-like predicted oxidoreductase
MLGECTKETCFEILDFFFEMGGNFIDTSNNYQAEESETWIGEWMTSRKVRDQIVLATKFTTAYPAPGVASTPKIMANYQGQHAKSIHLSVEASLKKLQTSYIDLIYIHWWDFTTGIPEVMQSLNHLVVQGKVLYLGISDTPAWVVSKANQYARDHNLRQFSVYQGQWSAADRDFERDIIPMCRDEGMALAPWGALGGGQFKTEEQRKAAASGRGGAMPAENKIKLSETLEKIAKKKNTVLTSIALAYVMHKAPNVYPIVGGRNVNHLKGNIEALSIELSEEDIDEIEGTVPFDVGFPMKFLFEFRGAQKYRTTMTGGDIGLLKSAALLDAPEWPRPNKPHSLDDAEKMK